MNTNPNTKRHIADMTRRDADRAHRAQLDTDTLRAYRTENARIAAIENGAHPTRLETELKLSVAIAGAFHAAREAIAPVLALAERFEVARTLYKFHDEYDGGDEHHPISYLPCAVAQGVAHYLVAGKLDNSQDWWPSWHADSRMGRTPQLAWLSEQLLEAAESYPAMRGTFERAAVMLSCEQCGGEGFQSAPHYEGQQHAVESQCELCGGSGVACPDCARVSEDDERGPRGER